MLLKNGLFAILTRAGALVKRKKSPAKSERKVLTSGDAAPSLGVGGRWFESRRRKCNSLKVQNILKNAMHF
jgi:hypothetical protein